MNQLHFNTAKSIAFAHTEWGVSRRATHDHQPTNYHGATDHKGNRYVLCDIPDEMPDFDTIVSGKAAKQVYPCVICGNDTGLSRKDMEMRMGLRVRWWLTVQKY